MNSDEHKCPSCFAPFALTVSTAIDNLQVKVYGCPLCRSYGRLVITSDSGLVVSSIRKLKHFGGY